MKKLTNTFILLLIASSIFAQTKSDSENVPYHGKLNFKKELIGQVLKGYYITTDGNKVDAAILCDVPSNLHNNEVELSIFKKANDEQGFTIENRNFDKKLSKNGLRAFFFGGSFVYKSRRQMAYFIGGSRYQQIGINWFRAIL